MTSSSILTTFPSTKPMFRKYSADSMLMDFFPMQTNASFMQLPVNILDTCCPQMASPWPHTKSKSSKTGQNPGKSRMFNPSLVLPTFTIISFMDIPKSPFHSHASPARVHPGTFPMSAILPLKDLKRLSPQLQSLPTGSWIPKLQSRLMPPTMHSPLFFQSQLQMANYTQLHSSQDVF